jgi:hypothetical protein
MRRCNGVTQRDIASRSDVRDKGSEIKYHPFRVYAGHFSYVVRPGFH